MRENIDIFLAQYWAEDYRLDSLSGDASARKYYRVTNGARKGIVCQDCDRDNFNRFVQAQRFLIKHSIRVPQVWAVDEEKMLLLEEDIGTDSLAWINYKLGVNTTFYHKILDEVYKLCHLPKDNECFIFQWAFDRKKYLEEFAMSQHYFNKCYLAQDDGNYDLLDLLVAELENIPYGLVHRDLHSRNIYSLNGTPVFIDFQDARLGPITYDLVSLLEDPYFILSDAQRDELKSYYFSKFDYPKEQLDYWYILTAVQRIYKILGSFTYLYYEKGKDNYLCYIANSVMRLHRVLDDLARVDKKWKPLSKELVARFYAD